MPVVVDPRSPSTHDPVAIGVNCCRELGMNYTQAFKNLGYTLVAPRTDWSAENEKGVCISIWAAEIKFKDGRPWLDTKVHCGPHEIWKDLPGNKKRVAHLARAVDELSGVIDVVIVQGTPGLGVKDADPWIPTSRKGMHWRVTSFDPSTGHFSAFVDKAPPV